MAIDRGKATLLTALLAVLAVVVYQAVGTSPAAPAGAATSRRAATPSNEARGGSGADSAQRAPEVHLESLEGQRAKPGTTDRNLFRFKPKAPPPAPRVPAPTVTAPPVPVVPSGPPPPPPITLKFVGVVEPAGKPKIAILSDGQGPPFMGKEGEAVAGRYRIIRIGVESIELSYLDGRGRQTIRLSGS